MTFKKSLTLSVTLLSVALSPSTAFSSDNLLMGEINCLVRNVFHEARGESLAGQKAVMDVTLNRAKDSRWPSNVCDVVYQEFQFSWTLDQVTADEQVYYSENATFREIRDRIIGWLDNYETDTLANHYATVETNVSWMESMKPLGIIGDHKFFIN